MKNEFPNPSAFPREDYQADSERGQTGMSLRDYFAAQSIRGGADSICDQLDPAGHKYTDAELAAHVERHAKAAYLLADALLAERSKP